MFVIRSAVAGTVVGNVVGTVVQAVVRRAAVIAVAAGFIGVLAAGRPGPEASVASGPPWISIETPVNPYDPATKDAFLLVRTYHHRTEGPTQLRGSAEGMVNGQRRTVALAFATTSREGAFALKKQWNDTGVWTLVITADQGEGSVAQALVEIGSDGEVARVQVPTRAGEGGMRLPRQLSAQEIDAALRRRAQVSEMRK